MEGNHVKFNSLFKELHSEKKNPLFNFSKFECWFSIIISILLTILGGLISHYNGIAEFTEIIKSVILGFGFALIGLLGFIIAGLSILISTFDQASINIIRESGKFKSLKSILFSFYFIGFIIAIEIISSFILFFSVSINIPFNLCFYLISSLSYSYIACFVLLYSVSLLGTCFHMFFIKYGCKDESSNVIYHEIDFLHLKVDALSKVLYNKQLYDVDDYLNSLENIAKKDYPNSKELIERINEYYNSDVG